MTKNSMNIYNNAMGYAGGNAAMEIAALLNVFVLRLPETLIRTLAAWQKRSQDRAHLKTLDAHLLNDIGLTRDEAALEISKPFWRS